MSSALTAPTMKSSIRCTRTPISHCGSIISCAIGNTSITACDPTSRSPTSPHWNSSPVGNSIGERQSVTNLLDEYTCLPVVATLRYASALHPAMARANKLLDQILRGGADANIPFSGMVQLLKRLGFQERIKGSHHIFSRDG